MRTAALLILTFALVLGGQEEDKAPPRLKRGVPKATDARAEPMPEQRPVPEASPVRVVITDSDGAVVAETGVKGPVGRSVTPVDDTIDKARRVVEEFQEKVPNFLCDQITFRNEGEGWPKPVWKLKDRVTAEVMHIDGAESYRNVKTGGKLLGLGRNKPPEQTGNWSTGDWVTISRDVLNPATDAKFCSIDNPECESCQ